MDHTLEQAETILNRIQGYTGVQGILITTNDGTVIRTTLDNMQTQQYSTLIPQVAGIAKSAVRDLDPEDDLNIIRIRSKKNEIMIADGTICSKRGSHFPLAKPYILVVVQTPQSE